MLNFTYLGEYKQEYFKFESTFGESFLFFARQKTGDQEYALAKSDLGFWLMKFDGETSAAYFLGMSPNQYYLNYVQNQALFADGFLQFQGSFVKRTGKWKFSKIADGKLFRIKAEDVFRDTDGDGYNDIFENSFGLNPKSEDSDGDGTNDFEDKNPQFQSEKNKFSVLYEKFIESPWRDIVYKKPNYDFAVYYSDCEYFHQIDPKIKVLFLSNDPEKNSAYVNVTDFEEKGKVDIRRDQKNKDMYIVNYNVGKNEFTFCYEFKNDKWQENKNCN